MRNYIMPNFILVFIQQQVCALSIKEMKVIWHSLLRVSSSQDNAEATCSIRQENEKSGDGCICSSNRIAKLAS